MKRFAVHLFLFPGVCLLLKSGWSSENETALEASNQLKAAYIRHLIEFAKFPAANTATEGPIVVGLMAERVDPVANTLSEAAEQLQLSSKNIPLKVIWIQEGTGRNLNLRNLQILYVSSVKNKDFLKQSDQLRDRPILTVGETEAFVEMGGIAGFKQVPFSSDKKATRLKPLINLDEAVKADTAFSNQLLCMKSALELVASEETCI